MGERTLENFWAMFNRKWYVVQKATDEETPDELRNRNVKEATVINFYVIKRIQPFQTPEYNHSATQKLTKNVEKGTQMAMQSPQ